MPVTRGAESTATETRERWYVRHAAWWWAFSAALLCNSLVTLEWSYPYCNDPDGPVYAGFGFPLPFTRYSGFASLEHVVTPAVLVLNVVGVGLVVYPALRRMLRALAPFRRVMRLTSAIALGVLVLAVAAQALDAVTWIPVKTIGLDQDGARYIDFRPVGVAWIARDAKPCTPSRFWFAPAKER